MVFFSIPPIVECCDATCGTMGEQVNLQKFKPNQILTSRDLEKWTTDCLSNLIVSWIAAVIHVRFFLWIKDRPSSSLTWISISFCKIWSEWKWTFYIYQRKNYLDFFLRVQAKFLISQIIQDSQYDVANRTVAPQYIFLNRAKSRPLILTFHF